MQFETTPIRSTPLCATKGFAPLYRLGERNSCPGCARSHWIMGRMVAEPGFCSTALPLDHVGTYSASPRIIKRSYQPAALPDCMRALL